MRFMIFFLVAAILIMEMVYPAEEQVNQSYLAAATPKGATEIDADLAIRVWEVSQWVSPPKDPAIAARKAVLIERFRRDPRQARLSIEAQAQLPTDGMIYIFRVLGAPVSTDGDQDIVFPDCKLVSEIYLPDASGLSHEDWENEKPWFDSYMQLQAEPDEGKRIEVILKCVLQKNMNSRLIMSELRRAIRGEIRLNKEMGNRIIAALDSKLSGGQLPTGVIVQSMEVMARLSCSEEVHAKTQFRCLAQYLISTLADPKRTFLQQLDAINWLQRVVDPKVVGQNQVLSAQVVATLKLRKQAIIDSSKTDESIRKALANEEVYGIPNYKKFISSLDTLISAISDKPQE